MYYFDSYVALECIADSVVICINVEHCKLYLTALGVTLTVVVIICVVCAVYGDFFSAGVAHAVTVKVLMHCTGLGRSPEKLSAGG